MGDPTVIYYFSFVGVLSAVESVVRACVFYYHM